jgi:hypothetical protein
VPRGFEDARPGRRSGHQAHAGPRSSGPIFRRQIAPEKQQADFPLPHRNAEKTRVISRWQKAPEGRRARFLAATSLPPKNKDDCPRGKRVAKKGRGVFFREIAAAGKTSAIFRCPLPLELRRA